MAPSRPPRLIYTIVILTVIAYVVALLLSSLGIVWKGFATDQLGFIPLRFSVGATGFLAPFVLTPLTATLAHADVLHLGFNMLMLVYCGRSVETVMGPWPTAVLYVVGAYVSAAGQFVASPMSPVPMIGASGAISALLAVYALLFGRNDVRRWGPIPAHWVRALWLAIAWTGLQWLVGLASHGGGYQIATAAHVGGFLAGLALARPLLAWRYRSA